MNEFQQGLRRGAEGFGALDASLETGEYGDQVQSALDELLVDLRSYANNKDLHYLKGDLAEPWHAGTLKVDAVRLAREVRAIGANFDFATTTISGPVCAMLPQHSQVSVYLARAVWVVP